MRPFLGFPSLLLKKHFLGTHFLYGCILWLHDEVFINTCGMNMIWLR